MRAKVSPVSAILTMQSTPSSLRRQTRHLYRIVTRWILAAFDFVGGGHSPQVRRCADILASTNLHMYDAKADFNETTSTPDVSQSSRCGTATLKILASWDIVRRSYRDGGSILVDCPSLVLLPGLKPHDLKGCMCAHRFPFFPTGLRYAQGWKG